MTTPELDPADLGWLLANAREHAASATLRSAAGFARGGPDEPVHRSQVGRWESGHTPAGYAVVRRYERTLGLPAGQLTLAADFMARRRDPLRVQPVVARPDRATWPQDVLSLVERALAPERMTGREWDVLSATLAAHPEVLLRGEDWKALLSRVTLESSVTCGLEYSFRAEAAARLAGHPRSGPVLTRLADEALADPTTQIFELVGQVQYSDDPGAAEVLVRHLERPEVRESVAWTTLYILTTLARHGRLARPLVVRAGTRALELLRDGERSVRTHRTAAALLDAIDPPTRTLIVSALQSQSRRRIARIVGEGKAMTAEELSEAGRRVETRLTELYGPRSRWAPPLQDLVRTATGAAHLEARGLALEVLHLLPQGRAVGLAYADELREHVAAHDVVRSDDALARLSWLAQPEDVPFLLSVATDGSLDPVTTQTAAAAVANVRHRTEAGAPTGPSVVAYDGALAEATYAAAVRLLEDPATGAATGGDPGRGFLYLLGMAGRFDLLGRLDTLARRRGASDWRPGLRWWLELPPHVRPERGGAAGLGLRGPGERSAS
ncbi:hypothetical protein [Lapillicoccus jejuensis]|uniref:HTH cro/C1-type domain-containing protein n=1 Tax=Lapillicoccus jejuensis TaxID=402171 RepID=A0A542DY67_9MICO|nr:hypothetical protein [Lapillicoccus jejuensis]TQJ07874.1 hypothetical protein FB458_0945 [Lapillicoccus jejuensis]